MAGDMANDGVAQLTLMKANTMPFQDVTVTDASHVVRARETLTMNRTQLVLTLEPGRYMVSGQSPSGHQARIPVTLAPGDDQRFAVDPLQSSPHEWLAEITARQQLPRSAANVSLSVVEAMGSLPLEALKEVSPRSSLSLPTGVVFHAALGQVANAQQALGRRLGLRGRPQRNTRRPGDVSLRSYLWNPRGSRWIRSELIDMARGEYAMDYTWLRFPPRPALDDPLREAIHLIGAFRQDQPARFIALPLFSKGAQLVLSHGGAGGASGEEVSRSGSDSLGDGSPSDQAPRFDWYLSAIDNDIDALLQSLRGRGFADTDAVSDAAFAVADKALHDKIHDPEAAVVAALFLLRHRRLDRRANWVENLASWFPWSPDALALGAWTNLLFDTGDQQVVLAKLAKVHKAGPPQFLASRRLLRDLVSISRNSDGGSEDDTKDTRHLLDGLWARIGQEMQHELAAGPFHSFMTEFGADLP